MCKTCVAESCVIHLCQHISNTHKTPHMYYRCSTFGLVMNSPFIIVEGLLLELNIWNSLKYLSHIMDYNNQAVFIWCKMMQIYIPLLYLKQKTVWISCPIWCSHFLAHLVDCLCYNNDWPGRSYWAQCTHQ